MDICRVNNGTAACSLMESWGFVCATGLRAVGAAAQQVTAWSGTAGSFSQPVTPPGEATENTISREIP